MRLILTIVAIFISAMLTAQAPALIPYQAIARNATGVPLASSTLNARFTIHDLIPNGASVWQELQTVSTSSLGLFTAQLGSSVSLTGVNWAVGAKFMQVEIDLGQGFLDMGTQQLLSVPYALYSGDAPDEQQLSVSETGDTLFLDNGGFVIIPGISLANNGVSSGIGAHTCGTPNIHNPNLNYGSMTDQQGRVYKTIVIGTQEWMAENLNTSIYRNGDVISTGLSNAEWENTINTQQGAWAYFNNDESYACPYGKLYNWYSCVDARQLCPVGWHVPTDPEWTVLTTYLGGTGVAGSKMKTTGTIEAATGLWLSPFSPNAVGTNSSGFSGAPGGDRLSVGQYGNFAGQGSWWSASEFDSTYSWQLSLSAGTPAANRNGYNRQTGLSVRCLRD
jgi:uncharacterized protein (TIGR02145 family)